MNRRELLRTALGGSVGIALIGVHRACLANADLDAGVRYPFLSDHERYMIAAIAELIIPQTDTPGAVEAGAPGFIELILSDWHTEEERQPVVDGIRSLDEQCTRDHARSFLDCTIDQQTQALAAQEDSDFFAMLKKLTVYGYYTSEVGASAELIFNPAPGRYTTIDFADVGKQWVN